MDFTTMDLFFLQDVLQNMANGFKMAIEKHNEYMTIMKNSLNDEFGLQGFENSALKKKLQHLTGKITLNRVKLISYNKLFGEVSDIDLLIKLIKNVNILNLDKDIIPVLKIHKELTQIIKSSSISEVRYVAYTLIFANIESCYRDCINILERCVKVINDEINATRDDLDKFLRGNNGDSK